MSTPGIIGKAGEYVRVVAVIVVLALVGAGVVFALRGDGSRTLTVDFEQTNSVYKKSDVKVLGVPVGTVESLTPKGDVVRVKIKYDAKYKLPADVKAVVVSPSIVGDRFIQLAPAYDGGAVLADNAYIPRERTAVPIELDAIYQSLDDLSTALGPQGANSEGALSNLIDDTAGQLDGQGAQLNETLKNFGKLSTTLSNNKDELFGSLREVEQFVSLLKTNDAAVRRFNDSTARVSTVLEGERDDLQATLAALSKALVDVNALVKENRGALRDNIDNVASLAAMLATHADDLEKSAIAAPTALSNVALTYNGKSGALDTRAALTEVITGGLGNPASLLCNLLGETEEDQVCAALKQLFGALPNPLAPEAKGQPPALPEVPGLPRSAASSSVPIERVHDSLRDMLAVN